MSKKFDISGDRRQSNGDRDRQLHRIATSALEQVTLAVARCGSHHRRSNKEGVIKTDIANAREKVIEATANLHAALDAEARGNPYAAADHYGIAESAADTALDYCGVDEVIGAAS